MKPPAFWNRMFVTCWPKKVWLALFINIYWHFCFVRFCSVFVSIFLSTILYILSRLSPNEESVKKGLNYSTIDKNEILEYSSLSFSTCSLFHSIFNFFVPAYFFQSWLLFLLPYFIGDTSVSPFIRICLFVYVFTDWFLKTSSLFSFGTATRMRTSRSTSSSCITAT